MANTPGSYWTAERIEQLKRLWAEGLSASQVAAQIGGVTRSAVLGKVHRLGLAERTQVNPSAAPRPSKPDLPSETGGISEPAPPQSSAPPTPAVAAVAHAAKPATCEQQELAIPLSERVTILDLREAMCRWPLGDPATAEFRFCGARVSTNLPYCTPHAALAYVPAERRRPQRLAARA
jgi:GcrA cell cycle regulator